MTSEILVPAPCPDVGIETIFDRAQAHFAHGRLAAAEADCRALLARRPASPSGRYLLAQVVLAQGRQHEGLELYEARIDLLAARGVSADPELGYPRWSGEPPAGKRILISPEQGFGDQIQFARYIPALVEMGARVTLMAPPELAGLLGGLGATVIAITQGVHIPPHDLWVYHGSLPWLLAGAPAPVPYLPARRPARPSGRIGVVWQGDPTHPNDRNRSFGPGVFRPLLALGLHPIALAPQHSGARDFEATARIIDQLDAVVTVDTAVAHLAGAMGRPVHVALPFLRTDWRWMRSRSDTALYPSMKLHRQGPDLDWDPVVAAIARDLVSVGPAEARAAPEPSGPVRASMAGAL